MQYMNAGLLGMAKQAVAAIRVILQNWLQLQILRGGTGGAVTGSITAEKLFIHTDPGTGSGSGDVRLDKLLAKVTSPGCGA